MNKKIKSKKRKWPKVILGLFILVAAAGAGAAYYVAFSKNTTATSEEYFYIRSDDSYEQVREKLMAQQVVENFNTFDMVAKQMNLPNTYKSGRYKLKSDFSNAELVRLLRSGKWEKVVVKLQAEMTREQLLDYFVDNLEISRMDLDKAMEGEWVSQNGFTEENKWCIFLPDYYHFNWATPADKLVRRFVDEYNKFWTKDRQNKAKKQGLNSKEACILASIVDGEAIHVSEMPTIAGLYLNRINKGILLQADPTVLYVVGREGRRRVLNRDLKKDDPYNTYLYKGLPPGPIFFPDKRAIKACLNPQKHNYIFMCARPDGSYYHNFTASAAQHNRNAAAYRRSLDQQGVRR